MNKIFSWIKGVMTGKHKYSISNKLNSIYDITRAAKTLDLVAMHFVDDKGEPSMIILVKKDRYEEIKQHIKFTLDMNHTEKDFH